MDVSTPRAAGGALIRRLRSAYRTISSRPEWPVAAPILAFRLMLDIGYALAVAPRWAYQHMGLDPSLWRLVASYLLTYVLAAMYARYARPRSVSRVLLALLLVLPIIPTLSYWALAGASTMHTLIMVLVFPVVLAASKTRLPHMRLPDQWGTWTLRICGAAIGVVLVRLILIVGWDDFSLNNVTAYGVRLQMADTLNAGIWGYLNTWSLKVFPLVLLVWSLLKRRFDWAILAVVTVIMLYGFTGNRSSPLFAVFVIVLYLLRRKADLSIGLFRSLSLVTGVSTLLAVLGVGFWSSLLTRRLLFVPPMLNFAYYEYFAEHGHVFMSNSVLRAFITYPFNAPPPALIGDLLFPGRGTWSNTGFIGTSFMHFGILGVLGFALVVGLLIAVADRIGHERMPLWASVALVAIPFTALFGSSDLTTSLATHGLALSLVARATLSPPPPDPTLATRVAQVTVVHPLTDVRILHKQCRTLAAAGYQVTLIVSTPDLYAADDVAVRALPVETTRTRRLILSGFRALREAIAVDAGLYHLHDPELLWVGVLLRLRGRVVVMDMHENVAAQILDKHWIPESRRLLISRAYRTLEQLCVPFMSHMVTATPDIAHLYPHRKTTVIRNYPLLSESADGPLSLYADRAATAIYAGGISRSRGVFEMLDAIDLARATHDVSLVLAGTPMTEALAAEMASHAAWPVVDHRGWVDRSGIWQALASSRIGLVVLTPTPNHLTSLPIKMFEYMAAGLPLVASDFPVWREIIEHEECGLLVDPLDPVAIAGAITWLLDHPVEAAEMGARGRRAVLRRYNWEREGVQLVALYEQLLQPFAAGDDLTGE